MLSNIKIYLTQIVAIFFTYTAISEFLKSALILASILFTVQRIYSGYLDLKERKNKQSNK